MRPFLTLPARARSATSHNVLIFRGNNQRYIRLTSTCRYQVTQRLVNIPISNKKDGRKEYPMSTSRIDSNGRADNINHAVLHGKGKKAVTRSVRIDNQQWCRLTTVFLVQQAGWSVQSPAFPRPRVEMGVQVSPTGTVTPEMALRTPPMSPVSSVGFYGRRIRKLPTGKARGKRCLTENFWLQQYWLEVTH